MTIATERRKHVRHSIELPIQLQIVFPEATFTPVVLKGNFCNLSLGGTRIRVDNLSLSHYRKIMIGPRLSRVICQLPPEQKQVRLFGKILNFEVPGMEAKDTCFLGINFGENEQDDLKSLEEFIQSLGGD